LIEPIPGGNRVSRAGRTVRRAAWCVLPVVLGGLGHVAVLKTDLLRSLAVPLDGGARWRGRPVFGANKTWRGVIVMTGSTALASGAQAVLARRLRLSRAPEMQSARLNPWAAGAVYGITYCIAELPNSFVKRRLGIAPGARAMRGVWLQYLVDQADSVVGCLIPMRLLYGSTGGELATALVLGLAIHVAIDRARA
jgi:CDP-archaeol synthase